MDGRSPHSGTASPARNDLAVAGLLGLLALAVRAGFLLLTELPPYDPWRHLALVRNLRDGLGFTLFGGEPYVWYSPLWYYVCLPVPAWIGMDGTAALFSAAAAPALYLALRRNGEGSLVAIVSAGLVSASGPVVAYTCHYGPEGLALCLTVLALLTCTVPARTWTALLAGILFGLALVLRLNFAFSLFLFFPALRTPRRSAAMLAGLALPLIAQWWRNHRIISSRPFVFTWDGLATPTGDFNLLSTLVIQMHPDVGEALRRLHASVIPWPEWIVGPDGVSWGLLVFVACSLACLIASRRASLILAGLLPIVYFLVFDRSLSSNFFRIYLPVFLPFFVAVALAAERLYARNDRGRWLSVAVVSAALLGGAGLLLPQRIGTLEDLSAPPELIRQERYLVNSGRYHPESLIYRYPDRKFLGLPLDPADVDPLLAAYPAYRTVLWHDFSVQAEVEQWIRNDPRWRRVERARNPGGTGYELWRWSESPEGSR